jgi:ribosomal protein L34
VRIGNVQEPVVALVDHGSEINLMSLDFYKKGKWPINTKHGWKIRAATRAIEELHGACPNVHVKIGDVEIDQHFFVQETSSHPVILREPYIMAARMETKVLDNGSAYARMRSQDGRHSVQFLTDCLNHEHNRETLNDESRGDF